MFCFQCQETAKNQGCTVRGVCGKNDAVADLQDLLIHSLKGLSVVGEAAQKAALPLQDTGRFIADSLFTTITNANFDPEAITDRITEAVFRREQLKKAVCKAQGSDTDLFLKKLPDAATWQSHPDQYAAKAKDVGILATEDIDVRSLRETVIIGMKGVAAYASHAAALKAEDPEIWQSMMAALSATTRSLSLDEMIDQVMQTGHTAVKAMALLDAANTGAYGHPEITRVNTGAGNRPGILISGHDLKDLEELLIQSQNADVDIYTHSEMLPAHSYPAFKKFDHLKGNYGGSWWHQSKEFDSFNGPILMTTNCITPVKESYADRIFTTGMAGWPGARHIKETAPDPKKDFSALIEMAKGTRPPTSLEEGHIIGGFARNQVLQVADQVVDAVKKGAIKRFVVMAGCDGRMKSRSYFTDVAKSLPPDAVILTAGCAKYRYNKLPLGDIGGIPRVLDAGQCNDSYSLAVIAMKLQEAFGMDSVNDLPLSFDIGWYEQKAVAVLLALLALGFTGVRIGPTLPAFLSPNVAGVLVEKFNLMQTTDVAADVKAIMTEK